LIRTRWLARLTGLVVLLAVGSIAVLVQAQCSVEVTGSVVSFDEAFGSVGTDITAQALQEAGISVGDLVELRMSGYVLEVPVITELFPQLPQSLPGIILWGNAYIGGWYRNIAAEYDVALGDQLVICLVEKGGYLDEIAAREVDHVESRDECSSDEEYANFREVTCGDIAAGTLFRSSHPADGSVKSAYAHALMAQAGVQTIINVGASWNEPQQAFDNSEYYEARGEAEAVLATNIGLAVTWPRFKTELGRVLRFMIDHDPPYLIHCSLGQDRAGITSAVLEALAGADLQEAIDDYALTFANYYRIKPGHTLYPEVVEQLLSKFREMNYGAEVTSENLQDVIARYLTDEVGLSDSEICLLQEKLAGESRGDAPSEPGTAEGNATAVELIDAVPQEQGLEEVDGRLVLDDFDDGDLTSKLGLDWRSYTGDRGSLVSPIRVEQDSDGAHLLLDAVGSGFVGIESVLGELDLSAWDGIYLVIYTEVAASIAVNLRSEDALWPSGFRDAYVSRWVSATASPEAIYIPFLSLAVEAWRRERCPTCDTRADPTRPTSLQVEVSNPSEELLIYEVGFYSDMSVEADPATPLNTTTSMHVASTGSEYRGVMTDLRCMQERALDVLVYDWGANLLRIPLGLSGHCPTVVPRSLEEPCCNEEELLELDWLIEQCRARGVRVILDVHEFPGYYYIDDGLSDHSIWVDPQKQSALIDFWQVLAARYADSGDVIYGYDILNEPNEVDTTTWLDLAQRIVDAIRAVDPYHAVIIESVNYADPRTFSLLLPLDDENVIYSFHFYEPITFTMQRMRPPYVDVDYPGVLWGKTYIQDLLQPVRDFQLANGARILVSEFGLRCWVPSEGRIEYLRDTMDVFEEYGYDYVYSNYMHWSGASLTHEGVSVPFGRGVLPLYVGETDALGVFKSFLARNKSPLPPQGWEESYGLCLFDESHWDESTPTGPLARDLAWRLSGVLEVERSASQMLDELDLVDVDLLVTGSPYTRSYTEPEIEAVVEYVRDGGSLLFHTGEAPELPAERVYGINQLLANFGIMYQHAVLASHVPSWASSSPFGFSVPSMSAIPDLIGFDTGDHSLVNSGTLSVSPPASAILLTDENTWIDLNVNGIQNAGEPSCPCTVLAVAEFGLGRVAVVANHSFYDFCNWGAHRAVVFWLLRTDPAS